MSEQLEDDINQKTNFNENQAPVGLLSFSPGISVDHARVEAQRRRMQDRANALKEQKKARKAASVVGKAPLATSKLLNSATLSNEAKIQETFTIPSQENIRRGFLHPAVTGASLQNISIIPRESAALFQESLLSTPSTNDPLPLSSTPVVRSSARPKGNEEFLFKMPNLPKSNSSSEIALGDRSSTESLVIYPFKWNKATAYSKNAITEGRFQVLCTWANDFLKATDNVEFDAIPSSTNSQNITVKLDQLPKSAFDPCEGHKIKADIVSNKKLVALRICARDIFKNVPISTKIQQLISKGTIGVKDGLKIFSDFGIQKNLLHILTNINPYFLSIALESVCGWNPQRDCDVIQEMEKFLTAKVFTSPSLLSDKKISANGKVSLITPHGIRILHSHCLHKILCILVLVEHLKLSSAKWVLWPLFTMKSKIKTMTQIYELLSREIMSGSGRPLPVALSAAGFECKFKQTFVDEHIYTIPEDRGQALDFLKDGVFLGRLIEVVGNITPRSLLNKLRHPVDSERRFHNLKVIIENINETISRSVSVMDNARAMSFGSIEHTVDVLYPIYELYQKNSFNDLAILCRKLLPKIEFDNDIEIVILNYFANQIYREVLSCDDLNDGIVMAHTWRQLCPTAPIAEFFDGENLLDKVMNAAHVWLGVPQTPIMDRSSCLVYLNILLRRMLEHYQVDNAATTIQRAWKSYRILKLVKGSLKSPLAGIMLLERQTRALAMTPTRAVLNRGKNGSSRVASKNLFGTDRSDKDSESDDEYNTLKRVLSEVRAQRVEKEQEVGRHVEIPLFQFPEVCQRNRTRRDVLLLEISREHTITNMLENGQGDVAHFEQQISALDVVFARLEQQNKDYQETKQQTEQKNAEHLRTRSGDVRTATDELRKLQEAMAATQDRLSADRVLFDTEMKHMECDHLSKMTELDNQVISLESSLVQAKAEYEKLRTPADLDGEVQKRSTENQEEVFERTKKVQALHAEYQMLVENIVNLREGVVKTALENNMKLSELKSKHDEVIHGLSQEEESLKISLAENILQNEQLILAKNKQLKDQLVSEQESIARFDREYETKKLEVSKIREQLDDLTRDNSEGAFEKDVDPEIQQRLDIGREHLSMKRNYLRAIETELQTIRDEHSRLISAYEENAHAHEKFLIKESTATEGEILLVGRNIHALKESITEVQQAVSQIKINITHKIYETAIDPQVTENLQLAKENLQRLEDRANSLRNEKTQAEIDLEMCSSQFDMYKAQVENKMLEETKHLESVIEQKLHDLAAIKSDITRAREHADEIQESYPNFVTNFCQESLAKLRALEGDHEAVKQEEKEAKTKLAYFENLWEERRARRVALEEQKLENLRNQISTLKHNVLEETTAAQQVVAEYEQLENDYRNEAAKTLQQALRENLHRRAAEKAEHEALKNSREEAAVTIQKTWRGFFVRRAYSEHIASRKIKMDDYAGSMREQLTEADERKQTVAMRIANACDLLINGDLYDRKKSAFFLHRIIQLSPKIYGFKFLRADGVSRLIHCLKDTNRGIGCQEALQTVLQLNAQISDMCKFWNAKTFFHEFTDIWVVEHLKLLERFAADQLICDPAAHVIHKARRHLNFQLKPESHLFYLKKIFEKSQHEPKMRGLPNKHGHLKKIIKRLLNDFQTTSADLHADNKSAAMVRSGTGRF